MSSPSKKRLVMASNDPKPKDIAIVSPLTQNSSLSISSNIQHQTQEEEKQEQTFVANNTNSSLTQYYNWRLVDEFPPGYRFCPTDDELIVHYLQKKVNNEPLPFNKIKDVNLYMHNPDYLTDRFPIIGEKDWYFFTPRDRKYRNGNRPNRAAGDGYWKATGADKHVKHKDKVVGYKKALVFYLGKPPKGVKTNWIMHEFVVQGSPRSKKGQHDMRLDDWVLCKIYKKQSDKPKKGEGEQQEDQHEPTTNSSTVSEENAPSANENDLEAKNYDYNTIMSDYMIQSSELVPEYAQFVDACHPNFPKYSAYHQLLQQQQQQQPVFNYGGAQPISFRSHLVHPVDSMRIFKSKYCESENFSGVEYLAGGGDLLVNHPFCLEMVDGDGFLVNPPPNNYASPPPPQ